MAFTDIAHLRLLSQQIESSKLKSAKELVDFMGAMQAQDCVMAKWAIGLRLPGSTDKKIGIALDKGEIIRTHAMRPTWHFVSADDIYWMLELTAPQIKSATKARHKQLEFTEKILTKTNNIIEKSLRDGKHLTREELMAIIKKEKIATNDNRSSHIMLIAELDGIVCSGKIKNNKQTYALLSERVQKKKTFTRDEALALLAQKYFTSHCPATLQDFIWWSGLLVKDARQAFEMVKHNFISERIGSEIYWLTNSFSPNLKLKTSAYLLPAYDEFLISYKDRTASLTQEHNKKTVSTNGIFWPVVVINGKVTGSWKRTLKKDRVIVETSLFKQHSKTTIKLIEKAAGIFGKFLEKEAETFHNISR